HIRGELAREEIIVRQSNALELERDLQILIDAHDLEDLVGQPLHDFGARIITLVHTMPEAHQAAAFTALHALDELRNVLDAADLLDHAQYLLVRSTVQRTKQCGNARRDS